MKEGKEEGEDEGRGGEGRRREDGRRRDEKNEEEKGGVVQRGPYHMSSDEDG